MALYSSLSNSYTSAFPALNSLPTFFQSRKRRGSYNHTPCQHQHLLVPPKYPKYLKNTMFADLVQVQYEAINKQHKKQQPKENNNNNMETHHGLLNWYDLDLRLPTVWNNNDKAKHIDVTGDGLELKYSGDHGRTEGHAGSVRSNFPMIPQCGIFYFETEIISKGEDGYIGIGFFTKTNDLDRLPGWDTDSFGYHGDDGHSFKSSGTGNHYGPCFTTRDIIGCGINFDDRTAFYTKNGSFLGIAFSNIDINKSYYPAIGLRTPGEHVKTNFGNEEFIFDLDSYIESKKHSLKKEILLNEDKQQQLKKSTSRSSTENKDITNLILTHLTHYGYVATAKSLYKDCKNILGNETSLEKKLDNTDTDQRQSIRQAIMDGNIDKAISLTNQYYSGLLQENEHGMDMIFELECGKFIEIMRSYMEHKSSLELEENRQDEDVNMKKSSISQFNSDNNNHPINSFNHIDKTEISNMDVDDDIAKINSGSINNNDYHHHHRSSVLNTFTTPENNLHILQNQNNNHNNNNNNNNNKTSKRLSWASIAASSIDPSESQEKLKPNKSSSSTTHSSSSTTISTSSSSTAISVCDTEMSESNQLNPMDTSHSNNNDDQNCIMEVEVEEEEKGSPYSTDEVGASILNSAMNLGQQLQSRCRADPRPHISQRLTDIFSLFAYSKIENSPAAHLLNISCRDKLATKLNNFILEFRCENELSTLEKTYQQIIEVNKQLAYDGNGKAALLKMDSLDNVPCLTNLYDDD